jgi:signal transduction histidine kinase
VAEFDISSLLQVRREVLLTLVLVNAGFVALFSLAGYAVMRRLLRPISVLTEHVNRARAGKFEEIPTALLRDDRTEIGALMVSFNQLAGAQRERELLTRRLAKEEKSALLGKLASGMAHEVNNPLGGMLNVIDTLRKHGDNRETRLRALDLLERGLIGIANVVRATLTTYRGSPVERRFHSRDLDDLQFLLKHEVGRRKLILQWSNNLPDALSIDGSTLRQVSLNLLLNACAASPSGPRVEFSAEIHGGAVVIRVRDQGPGLPAAVRGLFEHPELAPTVPTEDLGLGVWTVCRLVKRVGGRIDILRSDKLGTDLRVTIPLDFVEEIDAVA